jgi:predicted extracellular nuclease
VNFTGWSFDDASSSPGSVSLSLFGVVNPGESVILTEASANDFRSVWGLSSSVKVIGGNTNNLGRDDVINLYNGSTLVDRLTYNDEAVSGTLRAQNVSGNPTSLSLLGSPYDASGWVAAVVGDTYGSHMEVANTNGNVDIGNPGYFALAAAPVPLPAAAWLLISGVAGLFGFGRRKRAA